MPLLLLALLISPSTAALFETSLSQQDDHEIQTLVQLAHDILATSEEYSECSLVISRRENQTSPHLEAFVRSEQEDFRSNVLFNADGPTSQKGMKVKAWNEYRGINKPEQLYSFSTMPPEIMSRRWPGGSCTLNLFILDSPEDLPDLILQTGAFIRIRNLDDLFLFHFRKGQPEHMMMQHPAAGIKFKLASSRNEKDDKALALQTVCFFCLEGGHPETLHLPTYPIFNTTGDDLYPDLVRNGNGLTAVMPFFEHADSYQARRRAKLWGRLELSLGDNIALSLDDYYGVHAVLTIPASVHTNADYQYPNGTWGGFTGEMLSGKYQAVLVFVLTDEIYRQVYVGSAGWQMHMTFVTASPKAYLKWYQLILPFTWGTWVALSASIGVCSLVLHRLLNRAGPSRRRTSLASCFASLIRILLEQPPDLPDVTGVRIMIGSFWIVAMVVTCGYRCKYVGMAMVPDMEKLPTTFEQLYISGYKAVTPYRNIVVAQQIIPHLKNPSHIRLFNESSLTSESETCMEAVLDNPRVACMMCEFMLHEVMGQFQESKDKMRVSPTKEFPTTTRLIVPRGSVYSHEVNQYISHIFQSGLLDMWVKESNRLRARRSGAKVQEEEEETRSFLRLMHLSIIFWSWAGAMGTGLVILIAEISAKYGQRKRITQGILMEPQKQIERQDMARNFSRLRSPVVVTPHKSQVTCAKEENAGI